MGTPFFRRVAFGRGDAERRRQRVPTQSVGTRVFLLSNPIRMLKSQFGWQ
jgi:hypothetical protein